MGSLTIEEVATGLGFFVAALLMGLGFFNAKRKPAAEDPSPKLTVAGALIDGTDARALTAALDRNTKAVNGAAEATEDSTRRIENATTEIQRMTIELARGKR